MPEALAGRKRGGGAVGKEQEARADGEGRRGETGAKERVRQGAESAMGNIRERG